MQLGGEGVVEFYRQASDSATLEALQRWDKGVRVLNIQEFTRQFVPGRSWLVTRKGDLDQANGMSIRLSPEGPVPSAKGEARIVVHTSLGAAPGFSTSGGGWCVCGPSAVGCGICSLRRVAISIRPQKSFALSSVSLVLIQSGGTPGVVVSVHSSGQNGFPENVVEQWRVPGLPTAQKPTITSLRSSLKPVLGAGQTYWVVAQPSAD